MTKRALSDLLGDTVVKEEVEKTWKIPKLEDSEDDIHSVSTSTSTPPPMSPSNPASQHFLEVTCGSLVGVLHMEHFLCPGIREKCITTADNPGELLTPVEFTIKADKIRQKDWKGAIKHQGRMLRTLMEYKQLDFHNHATACSYKCHSRNYITKANNLEQPKPKKVPKAQKTEAHSTRHLQFQPAVSVSANVNQFAEMLKNPDIIAYLASQMSVDVQKRQGEAEKYRKAKLDAISKMMVNDPSTFWTQVYRSNLIQSVMGSMTSHITQLVNSMTAGRHFADSASKLSQIMQVLGITEKMSERVCGHFEMPPTYKIEQDPAPRRPSNEQIIQLLQSIQNIQNNTAPPPRETPPPKCATPTLQTLLETNNNKNPSEGMTSSEKLEFIVSHISSK